MSVIYTRGKNTGQIGRDMMHHIATGGACNVSQEGYKIRNGQPNTPRTVNVRTQQEHGERDRDHEAAAHGGPDIFCIESSSQDAACSILV